MFGSQELEDHRMQRSMVRLSQTTRSVQPLWRSHVDLSVIGFASDDGLHYDEKTYIKLYKYIKTAVNNNYSD